MFNLYDRVLHKPTGKPCFVIDIDDGSDAGMEQCGIVYGVEAEDQDDPDWFYWAEEYELVKLPEHK